MSAPKGKNGFAEEDLLFRLLRQLDTAPEASQRATAEALGISLGGLNSLLRNAAESGLVKSVNATAPTRDNATLTR